MEKITLSDIEFGYADGDTESRLENFLDLFYTGNNKYEEIMDNNHFIISGRKGTGKTILAKYIQLKHNKKLYITKYEKLNKMYLEEYIHMENPDINVNDRILFQDYYLMLQLAHIIVDNENYKSFKSFKDGYGCIKGFYKRIKYKQALVALRRYYDEICPQDKFKDVERKTLRKIMSSITVGYKKNSNKFDMQNQLEESSEKKQKLTNFFERQRVLKKLVYECLKYITIILFIDDLDETRIEDKKHRTSFLISLVKKVNDINKEDVMYRSHSKIILLLRDDISREFASNDPNIQKIITDCSVELNWFYDYSNSQLSDMIMHKIKASNKQFKDYSLQKVRDKLFPKKKKQQDPFDYIVRYGFGRPRDVITYLNNIKKNFPSYTNFSLQIIRKSELAYSKDILAEIKSEMTLTWDSNQIEDVFKLLREFAKDTFTLMELEEYYKSKSKRYISISDTIENVLTYLYQLGVIGTFRIEKCEKNKQKNVYTWSFRGNAPNRPNFNEIISIHYGIRKALKILEN